MQIGLPDVFPNTRRFHSDTAPSFRRAKNNRAIWAGGLSPEARTHILRASLKSCAHLQTTKHSGNLSLLLSAPTHKWYQHSPSEAPRGTPARSHHLPLSQQVRKKARAEPRQPRHSENSPRRVRPPQTHTESCQKSAYRADNSFCLCR